MYSCGYGRHTQRQPYGGCARFLFSVGKLRFLAEDLRVVARRHAQRQPYLFSIGILQYPLTYLDVAMSQHNN